MAEKFTDLCHRCSFSKEVRRQTVAEKVSAGVRRLQSCTRKGTPYDFAYYARPNVAARSVYAQEYVTR